MDDNFLLARLNNEHFINVYEKSTLLLILIVIRKSNLTNYSYSQRSVNQIYFAIISSTIF
jgi:hypothetical protein